MSDRPEWFAPKRYGYGAGVPIRWQGWAVLGGAMLMGAGLGFMFHDRPVQFVAAMVPVLVTLMIITARTTRGGWRWRWGKED